MYCSMCGKQIPEESKFCPECGAPVEAPAPQPEPVQPVEQPAPQPEPVQQVQQPAPQPEPVQQVQQPALQPEPVQQVQQPAPQPEPVQQVQQPAPQQPAEKKKSKLKLWIILGASVTVVVAAVLVFFLAIFPELTARHVNMGDYVKVSFYKESYVNGYINGTVRLDLEKAYKEMVENPSEISSYEFAKFFDSGFKYEFKKQSLNDTIKTRVKFNSAFYNINDLGKRIGVRFDENAETNISVQKAVSDNKVTVMEPVDFDAFALIDKCYYTKGLSNKDIGICVESKEMKKDGYLIHVYGFDGTYGSDSGSLYIEKDKKSLAYISFEADKSKADNGAKVKFTLDFTANEDNKNLVNGSPFIITKTEKEYTVKPQEGLTVKQAKSVLGKVRKKVREYYSSTGYNLSIDGIYLFTARNKNSKDNNMLVTLISKSSKKYKSKYHVAFIQKNCYIDEHASKGSDKFKYETTDYKYDYKSKASLWKTVKKTYGSKYVIKTVQ